MEQEKIKEIINQTSTLLKENNEWIERYSGYIADIKAIDITKDFRTPEALSLYSAVSKRDGNEFDLRFLGQSVGTVKLKGNNITLKPKNENNTNYFEGYSKLQMPDEIDWHSKEATNFRKFFRDLMSNETNNVKLKSPEHRLENQLLKEFAKNKSEDKALCHIQPVRLFGCFFQMPTPLKASDHNPEYAKQYGGGIDILARVTSSNGEKRRCIMELKDENKPTESQADAMKQAVTYAVFIAHLFRSKSGQDWWDLFRAQEDSKPVPENLNIDVVTVMPEGTSEEFCDQEISLEGLSTTLHCHSLYYDNDAFQKGEFKFSGTYPNQLMKK